MLSYGRHRRPQPLLQAPKITFMSKQPISGPFSPESTVTTSSGYSTGGSSVSATRNATSKKSSSSSSIARKQQQSTCKTKPTGLHNLFTKLKNLLLPSKMKHIDSRPMRSTASREISSTNILRQYHPHLILYDAPLPTTSTPISLPFTYYPTSPIRQSRTNYEKISAWLNHTEKLAQNEHDNYHFLLTDASQQQSISSSSFTAASEIDNQGITVVMKRTPTNVKPPKRSSSLVTKVTRPKIEGQSPRTISPASSFSSSILTKGMSDRLSPPSPKIVDHPPKSNRRRTIDFSRRRAVASTNEQTTNKENLSNKQDAYQFSPSTPANKVEIHLPLSKHVVAKKYYFHSNPSKTTEDLLNDSYGLVLLNRQQPRQTKVAPVSAALMTSQVPNQHASPKKSNPRMTIPQPLPNRIESLDDFLCDQEVESYFYPTSTCPDHIYTNLEYHPTDSYQSYIHGTLC